MKIYDCFTYCGEDLLLEIRLKTLNDKIDKFVIIEGDRYFNGDPKPKLFDINKFISFKSKIKYYFINDFPVHDGNNWNYEYFQRNKINLGLEGLNDNDIVLISDVDEIPNLKNNKFKEFDSTVFLQNMYYYKFNIHYHSGLKWSKKWPGTKSCKFKFFKTAQQVREFRVKKIPWWRFDRKVKRYIEHDGGWHFAYLMDTKQISKKISRFSHEIEHLLKDQNYDENKLKDIELIKKKILKLEDPYGRNDVKLMKVNLDKSFPEEILKNQKKYSNFII